MLNSNTEIHTIKIPIIKGYQILNCRTDKSNHHRVIMTDITEENEKDLDDKKSITINRDGFAFNIKPSDVLAYGEIDFTTDSADYDVLQTFGWLSDSPVRIPSDYDYEHHECHSPINAIRYSECTNCAKQAQYIHGCLNKPKRVIIFQSILHK